jgi:hypothetical protein
MWKPYGDHYATIDEEWKLTFCIREGYILRNKEMGIIYFLDSEDIINAIAEATVKIMHERTT